MGCDGGPGWPWVETLALECEFFGQITSPSHVF